MATVFVVDDAVEIRMALSRLLACAGYDVRSFDSEERFLEVQECEEAACRALDVSLPGLTNLESQPGLAASTHDRPVVVLTGCEDLQVSVQAMKAGATAFMGNLIDDQCLCAADNQTLPRDWEERRRRRMRGIVEQRVASLTRRERQVLQQVVLGRRNKQIAADLGTSEKTVKSQRGHMMHKMGARSVPELVWLAALVGIAMETTVRALPGPSLAGQRSNRAHEAVAPPTARCA